MPCVRSLHERMHEVLFLSLFGMGVILGMGVVSCYLRGAVWGYRAATPGTLRALMRYGAGFS